MGRKINLLQGHVAELIAAGEVVERPSSIVKELIENAIDAGANAITVEIGEGGIRLIRITDNGGGIGREDVPTAFLRHATSKIACEEDLGHIGTLGFRGEALAAIAAVCRVELLTRTPDNQLGTRYCIEGGVGGECEDAGCPQGTTIIARDIFYNTPARMKFLKKNVTEGNAVESVVQKTALSHPQISFRFIRDGVDKLHTPGTGRLKDAVRELFGKSVADNLIEVSHEAPPYRVSGYISKPQYAKSNRTLQHFYVNGRFVKTKTGMAALEQGYKNVLMAGKFPACFLFIEMPNELVDVNVHPAKIEVRFAAENDVFRAVYTAAKSAILNFSDRTAALSPGRAKAAEQPLPLEKGAGGWRPAAPFAGESAARGTGELHSTAAAPRTPDGRYGIGVSGAAADLLRRSAALRGETLGERPAPATERPAPKAASQQPTRLSGIFSAKGERRPETAPVRPASPRPAALSAPADSVAQEDGQLQWAAPSAGGAEGEVPTVVGELFHTYILACTEDRFFIVDKHAAHERILFERLKREYRQIARQILLEPVAVTLAPEEISAVLEHRELLQNAGFIAEELGVSAMVVREIPSFLQNCDIAGIFEEVASNLAKGEQEVSASHIDWLFNSIACRAAIKGGNRSTQYELQQLMEDIYRYDIVKYCPHGRPIVIEQTKKDIEKLFGRL